MPLRRPKPGAVIDKRLDHKTLPAVRRQADRVFDEKKGDFDFYDELERFVGESMLHASGQKFSATLQGSPQKALDAAALAGFPRVSHEGMDRLKQTLKIYSTDFFMDGGNTTGKWIYSDKSADGEAVVKSIQDIDYLWEFIGGRLPSDYNYIDGTSAGPDVGSYRIEKLVFEGRWFMPAGTKGALDGVVYRGVGGPIRNWHEDGITYRNLRRAISFLPRQKGDVPIFHRVTGEKSSARAHTSVAVMSFTRGTFTSCDYAIYAEGWATLCNIKLVNTNLESGGRILLRERSLFGYFGIDNVMFEAQNDPVVVEGTYLGYNAELSGGYFEACQGYLYNFTGGEEKNDVVNYSCSMTLKPNYVFPVNYDHGKSRFVDFRNFSAHDPRMLIRGHRLYVDTDPASVRGWLAPIDPDERMTWIVTNPIHQRHLIKYFDLSNGGLIQAKHFTQVDKQTQNTPLGFHQVFSDKLRHQCSSKIRNGQAVAISFLARRTDGTIGNIGLRITDDMETIELAATDPTLNPELSEEWRLVTVFYRHIGADTDRLMINIPNNDGKIEFTAPYTIHVANATVHVGIQYPQGLEKAYI